MAFPAGEYVQRSLDRRDLDLLRNDPCVRHIMLAGSFLTGAPLMAYSSRPCGRWMLYDFLVVRQITPSNPAHSVRGPKYVVYPTDMSLVHSAAPNPRKI